MEKEKILKYLTESVDELLERGNFESGHTFRPTQEETFKAIQSDCHNPELTIDQKLKGYLNLATGLGKTAIISGLIAGMFKSAERHGDKLKMLMVVPDNGLLDQTPDDLIKFSPSLKEKIGRYGNIYNDLNKSLTVMNIQGHDKLADADVIDATTYHVIVKDEAHRSTSIARVERHYEKFDTEGKDNATFQIAITATAHFDEEKSVEQTHERLIYAKRLNQAIRGGEGAAYIQAQPVVIRIEPDQIILSDEFNNAAVQDKADYRRKLMEKAYNEAVLEVYRDGIDEHTGDPLSDNQAAFYGRRTTQADDIADMLNSDPVLQKKAQELGFKGVAIPIHTKGMSSTEQRRRFDAVRNHEYMSIVGDSKFKEGFDYPPIKNIFDMPRKSLVDKEQIIGRGGREFWNEFKQRYEGLTVFDPVIYIGSRDPKEDEKLRAKALAKVTSVESILEDTCVLGPVAPMGYGITLLKKKDEFPEEAFSTIAIKKLKKNSFHIRIYDQYGEELDYGDVDIDKKMTKEIEDLFTDPQLLDKQSYHQYLAKELRLNVGHLVPEEGKPGKPKPFANNPNIEYHTDFGQIYRLEREKAKYRKEEWMEIPEEKFLAIQTEKKRTGAGAATIMKAMKNRDDGLSPDIISNIISGGTKSAPVDWIDQILNTLKRLPDLLEEEIIPENKKLRLTEEEKRTGLKGNAIFRKMENHPDRMEPHHAVTIVSGDKKYAPPSWVDALLSTYAQQPDAKVELETKPIPKRKIDKIQSEYRRTGVAGKTLFKSIKEHPTGLTAEILQRIVSGQRTSEAEGWSDAIISAYAELPDKVIKNKKPVRSDTASKLQSEFVRTGIGGAALFNKIKQPPPGLTKRLAASIVAGTTKNADPEHVKCLKYEYSKVASKDGSMPAKTEKKQLAFDTLTMASIVTAINEYRQTHGGKNPTTLSGDITSSPFDGTTNWAALDQNLRRGHFGLSDDPEWQRLNEKYDGKLTVSKVCKECPTQPRDLNATCEV